MNQRQSFFLGALTVTVIFIFLSYSIKQRQAALNPRPIVSTPKTQGSPKSVLIVSTPKKQGSPKSAINSQKSTAGASCVREVLNTLHKPSKHSSYRIESFQSPLPFTKLSQKCRSFLTPAPISPDRLKQLACFTVEPWFRHLGPNGWSRVRGAIHIIRDAFHQAGVPLFLDSGTALGSWRQHGQIPFDPDIDLAVFNQYKQRAIQVMAAIQRDHPNLIRNYMNGGSHFWRLDVIRPNKTRLFQIDVFVFTMKKKEKIVKTPQSPFTMRRLDRILPLVQRPFEGALFYTYRNMRDDYFPQLVGKDADEYCATHYWIPSFFKIPCGTKKVKCKELHYFNRFVHRWVQPDGHLVEVLFNRSHALSVFYSPEGV